MNDVVMDVISCSDMYIYKNYLIILKSKLQHEYIKTVITWLLQGVDSLTFVVPILLPFQYKCFVC